MVAKTITRSTSASSASKPRSSLQKASSSSSVSSMSKPTKPSSSTSLVQTSAKRSLKTGKAAASKKKNGANKFRDSEKRALLDGQTNQLFSKAGEGREEVKGDQFSYGVESSADKRRTRRQVDETALALDLLMKS